jgi:hypothetical protein
MCKDGVTRSGDQAAGWTSRDFGLCSRWGPSNLLSIACRNIKRKLCEASLLPQSSSKFLEYVELYLHAGSRGSLAGRSLVPDPMKEMNVFNLPNPSGRTWPWGLLSLYQKWVPETEK